MGFQQGLSGLNVSSRNLEVIGNNVANAGTYGAKSSRAEFADMYASALSGAGSNNVGIGATVASVSQQFTQGNITTTNSPMDMAINGNGFFQVTDGSKPTMYTRNGQFKIDRNGYIVNNQGHKLLGYQADTRGTIVSGTASPLQLPTSGIAPHATDQITMEMNFDSRQAVPTQTPLDFTDPRTYNFSTSQTVYDTKGQAVSLNYYYVKTSADNWDMYATANGTPVLNNGGTPPTAMRVASFTFPASGGTATNTSGLSAPGSAGTISTYDNTGAVKSTVSNGIFTLPTIPASTMASGALTQPITGVKMDMSQTTEYGAAFSITNLAQTGYAPGQLSSISVDPSGIVMARYSNGQSKPAGQVELATFRNPQGLQPQGGNEWSSTFASGDPVVGTPGAGNIGALQAGALEESNVDLTGELVNMMVAQRMYQANAQTIKTEDQVLQTLVNMR
ncbi:MAG: flagellar hook protein FlgE [Burkholderiales bacterium]|nr:flagellar hook protein FlgE [Burkholderiales bacterium]